MRKQVDIHGLEVVTDDSIPEGSDSTSVSDKSETDLLTVWADQICDPMVLAIRPFSTNVTDRSEREMVVGDLLEGARSDIKPVSISADAFGGSFYATLCEGSSDDEVAALATFRVVEMARGSVLLKDGESPGEGLSVSVLLESTQTMPKVLGGLTVTQTRWVNVGWIIPDRVPHNLPATTWLTAMQTAWGEVRKFRRSQTEYTPQQADEQTREAFRNRLT